MLESRKGGLPVDANVLRLIRGTNESKNHGTAKVYQLMADLLGSTSLAARPWQTLMMKCYVKRFTKVSASDEIIEM